MLTEAIYVLIYERSSYKLFARVLLSHVIMCVVACTLLFGYSAYYILPYALGMSVSSVHMSCNMSTMTACLVTLRQMLPCQSILRVCT